MGNDMSPLFSDVVACLGTPSLEIKKMVYLFLVSYGRSKPDQIQLVIPSFLQDCADHNPLIRALAIRTMSYIPLPVVTEALTDPLRHALKDRDPYVRKTAAICVAKVYTADPRRTERTGFVEMLRDLMLDSNATVVANAVAALVEISERHDGVAFRVNYTVANKLLTALQESSEWGQIYIMDALMTFVPQESKEAEIIAERITVQLQHGNSAVILTTIKVLLYLMNYMENRKLIEYICKKMGPPLVTMLSSGPEVQYVALRNILLIIQRRPAVLKNDVKVFFCKYNDPIYVKLAKLEIMYRLAREENFREVLAELQEYASEVDVDFVRKAVRSIGRLAIKVELAADECIEALLGLIDTKVTYVVQEAVIVIKDIFRRYPGRYEGIIPKLCENLDALDEPEAKAAMIWIIGQFADKIENSDELLDDLVYNFLEEPTEVQLALLSAVVKLFIYKSNSETSKEIVHKVLKWTTEEIDNPDLRDRGFMYWRLLAINPANAGEIVLAEKPPITTDSDRMDRGSLDQLADRANHTNHRRTSMDEATRQREQELRRARGEIACIECQRLKLRCDRKVPCASCIRRNRAAMCPNGHAWTDQETRSLLSDTAQLHRKLSEMSQRIRQLEDALEISHSANSTSHHPLLREELLAIKRGVAPPAPPPPSDGEPDSDYVEAMGTMSISERGISRFIGRLGGGESLFLLGNDGEGRAKPFTEELFPQQLARRSDAWLFMPPNSSAETVLSIIQKHMPPFARASSLCEAYLENFCWIVHVVARSQIIEELLPSCYRGSSPLGGANLSMTEGESQYGATCVHELALLLMVFATGALADLTLPPYNEEAERYYQMALAALSLTKVIGAPTLPAVQTVSLMAAYNAHCGRNDTLDLAGSLFALAANLGLSMGLHRDVAKWNFCESNADRRRNVFWELFTVDCWHNMANGKPPSSVLKYCDCKFPEKGSEYIGEDGRKELSYWRMRHQMGHITYAASDLFSGIQPVRYSQILDIDRKISEFVIPKHLQVPDENDNMEADGPMRIMQRMVAAVCRDGLLMYIHRGFFAKALLEHPANPLLSQYSHSYLSAYRSALSLLKVVRHHYSAFPNLVSRFWSLWSHAFSATVIIGSIVIKGRDPDTVRAALVELNLAVGLFEKAAQLSDRAKRSLPTLVRLREKAHKAVRSLNDLQPLPSNASDCKTPGEADDELLIFAGKNRLVKPKDEPLETSLPPLMSTPPSSTSITPPVHHVTHPDFSKPLNPKKEHSPVASRSQSSPEDSTLPPTPEGDTNVLGVPMNADLPAAWTAWSDQEALLINYLSSGADLHFAQNAAYTGEPDPSAFMWAEMGNSNNNSSGNSPEASGSAAQDVSLKLRQQQSTAPDFAALMNGMNGQEPSTSAFVNLPEGGLGMSQNQFPMQSGTTPWDMFF